MKKFTTVFLVSLASSLMLAQTPYRVKDIYPGPNQSNFDLKGVPLGNGILFSADDGINGEEPWFSDGTSLGTYLIKDIYPGSFGSFGSGAGYFKYGTNVLFVASDGVNGLELWITDGTTGGTSMVKDINPGISNSVPVSFEIIGSKVLFVANTSANGNELWITDGTSGGTNLVKDIWPGGASSNITSIVNTGLGYVFFVANDGVNGEELWKSDGTAGGTILMKDIKPGSAFSGVNMFDFSNNKLYFSANDGTNGTELWVSDGTTSGTTLVKDITQGSGSTAFYPAHGPYNNKYFFTATSPATGAELWETDGTTGGTIVNDLTPGTTGTYLASDFYIYNNDIYFLRWTSNGWGQDTLYFHKLTNTVSNTVLIKKFTGTYFYNNQSTGFEFAQVNNNKFIGVNSCYSGSTYFFASDGTAANSNLIYNNVYCYKTLVSKYPVPFINNTWIYGLGNGTGDFEPYTIDHTTLNTTLLKNINPSANFNGGSGGGSAIDWTNANYYFNGKYHFLANDGSTGVEMWSTDGTTGGTNLTMDIYPGSNSGPASYFGDFKALSTPNNLFFYANDGGTGIELWAFASSASGINEQNNLMQTLFVYPNPSSETLYFNLSAEYFSANKTEYEIYNSVGQVCSKGHLNDNKIDIAKLAQGYYLIKLRSEEGTNTVKFVKN